jgi:hypothetical protein
MMILTYLDPKRDFYTEVWTDCEQDMLSADALQIIKFVHPRTSDLER